MTTCCHCICINQLYSFFRHILTFNVILTMGWPIGELILAMEAYLIRDHFTLQLVSHAPMLLVIIVIFIAIPESTRWLISKGMYGQARKQAIKIAKTNNTTIPENVLNPASTTSGGRNEKIHGNLKIPSLN